MTRGKLYLIAAAVAFAGLGNSGAKAATVGNIYYFGNSLTDCCWTQRYTQRNQPNWADDLGPLVGATNSPTKSTNHAIGGAQSADGNVNQPIADFIAANNGGALSGFLPQVSRFTASGVTVEPMTLLEFGSGQTTYGPPLSRRRTKPSRPRATLSGRPASVLNRASQPSQTTS